MNSKLKNLLLAIVVCSGKLAAQTASYTPLYDDAAFASRTIDLSRPVGSIAGSAGTNSSGAVTYELPISMPAGTNGMAPKLSVVYSSLSGDGLLGMGWRLSGLSAITRAGWDTYHYGKVAAVSYESVSPYTTTSAGGGSAYAFERNDAFVLDGAYLYPKSGAYGKNGTIYLTEAETYSTTTSIGNISGGPEYFKVFSKDGSTLEFGTSTDSRVMSDDGMKVMMWLLTKIKDVNGNYIEFKYENASRDFRIIEISYTGNQTTGLVPYNKITFHYVERADKNVLYDAGYSIHSRSLLSRIEVRSESVLAKTYTFNYGQNFMTHSYLKSIEEAAADGSKLNDTRFKYGNNTSAVTEDINTDGITLSYNTQISSGDFDGDGLSDLLVYEFSEDPVTQQTYNLNVKVKKRSNVSSSYTTVGSLSFSGSGVRVENAYRKSYMTQRKVLPNMADFNGDGRQDIIISNFNTIPLSGSYVNELDYIYIYYTNADGSIPSSPSYTYTPPATAKRIMKGSDGQENYLFTGDFDGDGRSDFVTMLGGKIYYHSPARGVTNKDIAKVRLFLGSYPLSAAFDDLFKHADDIFVANMDGDAKSDLMVVGAGGVTRIFTFNFDAVLYELHLNQVSHDLSYPYRQQDISLGDFNGDGKTDILTGLRADLSSSATWKIGYFNGAEFIQSELVFDHVVKNQYKNTSSTDRIVIADFDGDGRTDILNVYTPNTSTPNTFNLYYSKGTGFDLEKIYNSYHTRISGFIAPGDYNGDGKSDMFSFAMEGYGLGHQVFTSFTPFSKAHLLEKVSDGFNRVTRFYYDVLTKGTGSGTTDFYTRGSGEVYPVNNIQYGMYVVTGLEDMNGIGGTSLTGFRYENLRHHRAGRGILGFEKVKSFNTTMDRRTETVYGLNRTFYVSYEQSVKTYIHSSNTLLSQSEPVFSFREKYGVFSPSYVYTNMLRPGGANGYILQNTQNTVSDLLRGTTTVAHDTFDSYGNVTNSGRVTTGGVSFSTSRVTTFIATSGSTIFNQPSQINESRRRGTLEPVLSRKSFVYNSRGLLTELTDGPGGSAAAMVHYTKSTYQYDDYGNITLSDRDSYFPTPTDPETKYTYDGFGRFIITEENSSGHKKEYTTHRFWGKPLTEKGINGLTTSYSYDSWGKLSSTTIPTGVGTSYTITYSDAWDPGTNRLYASAINDPSAPDTKTWYDYLERPVKTRQESFGGAWVNTVMTYDARGNVATTSRKYKDPEAPIVSTNTYDEHNRIKSESNVYGTTNYDYSDGGGYLTTTTHLPDGKIKVIREDASGKVLESKNGIGGTVVFEYDSRGNETSAGFKGTFGGIITTPVRKEYDYTGQLKKLIDLDAGTTTYNYNPMGQLTGQTDPAGKVTTYVYDKRGNVVEKNVGSEYKYTYTYYGPEKDYGLASEKVESATDGVITDTYDYAIGGGLTLHNKNTNGTELLKRYTYDAYNRPAVTEYPIVSSGLPAALATGSGFATLNQYDANGFLKKISTHLGGAAKVLYEQDEMNAEEQVSAYKRVDGLQAVTGYTNNMPTSFYTPGMQDLTTAYNLQNGNVTNRKDHLMVPTNPKEFFSYDALDRLKKSEAQIMGFAGTIYHTPLELSYDEMVSNTLSRGQIRTKSDVGTVYGYGGFPQNAVKKIITGSAAVISHETQNIQYNVLHKARRITEKIGGIDYEEQFVYDAADDRAYTRQLQDPASGTVARERWYMGDYEMQRKAGTTQHIHYIISDAGLCGMVVEEGGIFKYYSVYTDHLGSIVKVADDAGTTVAEQNYDAWGRERNPGTWNYYSAGSAPALPDWLYRGYTGHEMLPEYGLINMNGRLYDPANGRMLRPDNYIQDPLNTQSYNRFSYCFNNPLKYTDPDGNNPLLVMAAGGLINLGIQAINGNVTSFGAGVSYFAAGALGAGTAMVSGPVMSGIVTSVLNDVVTSKYSGQQVSNSQMAQNAVFAGATAGLGSLIGPSLTPSLSNVQSPMMRMAMQNAVGGAATGFTLSTAGSFMNGNNFGSSIEAGMNGAATGFATGAIAGAGLSIPYAKANNINPLTGRSTVRPQIDQIAPLPYAGDIRSQALDLKDNYNSGKNTVNIRTVAKEMQYDLDGEPHYNKSLKQYVSTPHTSSHEIHRGPNG
ncbi:MAG TPA: FG-GAP-like repeat-containing protein, partial [Chitinophagaceae bacterium]|nr:FG-GAP-like repeat-containing protein [Chitinophagaceae bacterium]